MIRSSGQDVTVIKKNVAEHPELEGIVALKSELLVV
jgi:hypothetical protein